ALSALVATLNSCSASGNGSGRFALSYGLLCVAPSSRYATPDDCPPAIEISFPPCMLRLDEMPAVPSGCTAAPVSAIKSTGLRPLSGSARMRSFPMTCPRPVLRVSTSGDAACTCTVSSTAPSDNSTLITGASLTCSTRPVRTYDLKPGRFTSSRYGPTGRLGSVYEPFASVTVVRFKAVAVCVAVTSAPGSTPPLESFTMPVICAVDPACACNSTLESRIATEPQTTSRRTRFIRPPERTRRRYGSRRSKQALGREYSCRHDNV